MKLKKPLLVLFAATAILAGCGPRTTPAERKAEFDAREQAKVEAVQQKMQNTYGADLQNSLTGYFNTHGITSENVKEGLTVPWVASQATVKGVSRFYEGVDSGHMVATGKTDAKGCPVFDIVLLESNGKYANRTDTQLPVCPKPAAAAVKGP